LKPDVVHAHDPMAVALAAMALNMGARGGAPRPLVVASRRVDFHLKRHAFSAWKYRQVDLFIAASGVIAHMLEGDGIPASKIVAVHDGVSLGFVDKQPAVDVHAAAFLPHNAPVVGNVAALAPHKGQKHFVAAAARVVREVPDARFVIVGEGELREALEKQIHDLGLGRHVSLMGFRPDALGLMKSLDVFVMSSITEGLGSAVLEAMACRRAVIGTRAGGIPEVVEDEVTGLLVPVHDDAALAAAIVRLLRDRPLADHLAVMGRQRVEHAFSVEHMVAQILGAYERGLAARGRG
jgi:glycosyltransferase involved in cell wall biosynthesis